MTRSQRIAALFRWCGHPFRSVARALMVLVNLTPRQMQSLTTLALIGGIIANSGWIYLYVQGVRREARSGMPYSSPFFAISLDVVQWLAICSGLFALFMCLIAFGADWLRVKYKDFEAGTGREAGKAARAVADAADDKAEQIEGES
ncbi:hypothetical protein [Croceibacterium aestuarii]|uniref:hypothetical protein n=1 Tax=Croceibacterium aestuarii TaxID=3064139 RepID=UPI00272DE623|nr:hypothetical protein [Croceibacterium sp. D39]